MFRIWAIPGLECHLRFDQSTALRSSVNSSIEDKSNDAEKFSVPICSTLRRKGLVFLAPFVGSLVGTYLCGPLADSVANHSTKRKHGIRETEMRLSVCAIAAILTVLGALMSGLCLKHHTHRAGPIVGYGVLSAGGQMGATLAMSYALDCHKSVSLLSALGM